MHASCESYTGQPSPGARLPLPLSPTTSARVYVFRYPDAGSPRLIEMTPLPEPFTLEECIAFTRWSGTKLELARVLDALGYVRRRTLNRNGWKFVWSLPL